MTIQTASVLYPVNTTTVDSGTGIDLRLLDSAQAGADDDTQTAAFTHTNDNVERTFDPATGGVTNTNNAGTTLFKTGWALRLTQDMTPTDDTNCNACLTTGTLTVNFQAAANQSGGTYVTGTETPTFRASLWSYDPATDTGSLIAAGSSAAVSWTAGSLGDLGTFKAVAVSIAVSTLYEFAQGSILMLQLGFNTGTVPNPTLGTANWTMTLRVDNAGTNVTFAASQGVRTLCATQGTASGVSAVTGVMAQLKPVVATAAGAATVSGVLGAVKGIVCTAAGSSSAAGVMAAVKGVVGTAAGSATATGRLALVKGMVGTVDIGAGGGGTTVYYPITIMED